MMVDGGIEIRGAKMKVTNSTVFHAALACEFDTNV